MRSSLRRVLGGLAVALALAAAAAPHAARPTVAAFTDTERAASAGMSALRLVAPQVTAIATCARPSALGGTFLAVRWRFPAATAPYSAFTPANTRWVFETQVTNGTTTGPDAAGVYTTSFTGDLVAGLLGSIVGGTLDVSLTTVYSPSPGNLWQSPDDTLIQQQIPLLVGSPTCSHQNGV